ncbi:neurogenic locus protein delta [Spodoptera litura]|uniref:Delta-like protein n=1 Tax=Spodoptera litura TaxID=69820 RepID=A0A9J7IIV8_SPOLT|nr:neurogenic locus protein delta [Spodoptera litura]
MRAPAVLIALLGFLPQVLTSGSFELRIKSFTNSLGRLSSGQCCDGSSNSDAPCLAPCRTKFRVCLKIYQANIDTTSPCTFGDITTPVLGGNSLDVPNLHVEGFSNPIVFPFDFTWPGTFTLIVEAWHDTNETSRSDDTLIARMTKQSVADVGGPWIEEEQRWGGAGSAHLKLSYRVTCAAHYYGAGCEVLCRPRDDAFGHYTCSPSGGIVCKAGWTGDYCSKPRCLPGCDAEHGHCLKPDECICHSGWVGELCDQCERHPGCVHGTCLRPWDCNCEEGWGGLFCNQDLNYCTNHRPCRNGGTCSCTVSLAELVSKQAGGHQRRVGGEGGEEALSGQQVAWIASVTAAVPLAALAAVLAIVCLRRRRARALRAADAEARAQNAANAGGHVIRNTWGKCDAPAPECQNAHNAAAEECKRKTLNTESARLLAALDPRLSRLSADSAYCANSDTSLVKRALEGGGVYVLDDHCLPPTYATQV